MTFIEYEIELERANGKTDRTSAFLPARLIQGQRLKVPKATAATTNSPKKQREMHRRLPAAGWAPSTGAI